MSLKIDWLDSAVITSLVVLQQERDKVSDWHIIDSNLPTAISCVNLNFFG